MGEETKIEWTDHTFSPWWGCEEVSPGCARCYARTFAVSRLKLPIWGPKAERRFFSDRHWAAPLKWARAAEREGVRRRVFCASMADVFEDRLDLVEPRERLFRLIEATPSLDWLLLTRRPENVQRLCRWSVRRGGTWPANVWLGTTAEDQKRLGERVEFLIQEPAAVRFLSVEPMLGPLDLTQWIGAYDVSKEQRERSISRGREWGVADRSGWSDLESVGTALEPVDWDHAQHSVPSPPGRETRTHRVHDGSRNVWKGSDSSTGTSTGLASFSRCDSQRSYDQSQERDQARQPDRESRTGHTSAADSSRDGGVGLEPIQKPQAVSWVIVGGESGRGARPFDLAWARSVVAQCRGAGVPVFVKQLGASPYESVSAATVGKGGVGLALKESKGGDMAEWPEDLRVREWPR